VVIVNYRQWEATANLVNRIRATPDARRGAVEVMVVDNHSPPHPLGARMRRWEGVSLRRWGANRGFARAVNEGCRLSRGQWVLLLNPDVSVSPHYIHEVLERADRLTAGEPRCGIVGFQLRNSDGSRQGSCGVYPTLLGTLAGLALPRARRKYRRQHGRQRRQVPWVTGCCLLLRRDCWQDLGGFDNDFFLYYEDVDLCRRARARGWSVWYDPGLGLIHHRPLHSRAVSPHLRLLTRHGLLTYSAKHWPYWQSKLLAGIVRVEVWARRIWARWRGDGEAAAYYAETGTLAAEMAAGRHAWARRRLGQCVRREEGMCAA
jgi:GT2 family glycosyltransferase